MKTLMAALLVAAVLTGVQPTSAETCVPDPRDPAEQVCVPVGPEDVVPDCVEEADCADVLSCLIDGGGECDAPGADCVEGGLDCVPPGPECLEDGAGDCVPPVEPVECVDDPEGCINADPTECLDDPDGCDGDPCEEDCEGPGSCLVDDGGDCNTPDPCENGCDPESPCGGVYVMDDGSDEPPAFEFNNGTAELCGSVITDPEPDCNLNMESWGGPGPGGTGPGWQNGISDWAIAAFSPHCPYVATPFVPAYADLGSLTNNPVKWWITGDEECKKNTNGWNGWGYRFQVHAQLQPTAYLGGHLFEVSYSNVTFVLSSGVWDGPEYHEVFDGAGMDDTERQLCERSYQLDRNIAAAKDVYDWADGELAHQGQIPSVGELALIGRAGGDYFITTGPMNGLCELAADLLTRAWRFSCDFTAVAGHVSLIVHANGRSLATSLSATVEEYVEDFT